MNTGIHNKLKELVGKEVDILYSNSGIIVSFPSTKDNVWLKYKVMRIGIDSTECIVLENDKDERFISIDYISTVINRK